MPGNVIAESASILLGVTLMSLWLCQMTALNLLAVKRKNSPAVILTMRLPENFVVTVELQLEQGHHKCLAPDDQSVFEPQMAIYTCDAQKYHHIPEDLPAFDKVPG